MQKFEKYLFMPAALIDARDAEMKQIVGTLLSLLRQTMCPPLIRILVDQKTQLNMDTIESMVLAKDGSKVSVTFQMDPSVAISSAKRNNNDLDMIRGLKSFKHVYGTHKKNDNIKVKFPVTHVINLIAGHGFMSGSSIEKLSYDWKEGKLYDVMFFRMYSGKEPIESKSAIFYLPSVKLLCANELWRPFLDKQRFYKTEHFKKDHNFLPLRNCTYGILERF